MVHETNPTPNGVEHGRSHYFIQIKEIPLNLRGFENLEGFWAWFIYPTLFPGLKPRATT